MEHQDLTDIKVFMAEINMRLKALEEVKLDPVNCALHNEALRRFAEQTVRIEKEISIVRKDLLTVQGQVGSQNMLKIGLGALGAGIVLALKFGIPALLEALKN